MTMPSLAQEAVLVPAPHVGVEPGVVRAAPRCPGRQPLGVSSTLLAATGSRRCRLAVVLVAQEGSSCCWRGAVLLDDGVADVGPVEAADEDARPAGLQAADDVGAREGVGGGGERDPRHAGEALVEHVQRQVVPSRKSWPHWLTQCASSIARTG